MRKAQYKRALLKLSGEALQGERGYGVDTATLRYLAGQIKSATELGVELAVVVGGGNIWRGATAQDTAAPWFYPAAYRSANSSLSLASRSSSVPPSRQARALALDPRFSPGAFPLASC